jgi:hypothetical protein
MRYRCYILFIFISLPLLISAQNDIPRPVFIGFKAHLAGKIFAHRDTLEELASGMPRGIQFDISRFNISEKSWRTCNCYARTGFSLAIFDYSNRDKLGQSYNLIFFLEPQFNINSKFTFSYRAGMGLTYLNRPFHPIQNPENLFYSSPISYMLLISLNGNYNLNDQWKLNAAIFYNHISNGGMRQPNLGMNFPSLSLGIDYVLNPSKSPLKKHQKEKRVSQEDFIYMKVSNSIKTVEANNNVNADVQKPVIGLEMGYLKPISTLNGFSAGFELIYDYSWKERNEQWNADFDYRTFNLLAGHNFLLGNFIFSQQLGYYLYKDYPNTDSRFYQRYGLYYKIGKYLNAGFSLKAHLEVAEIMDVRIGFQF